ncbi:MAG: DUF3883 domain-containing protein [Fimbriimonadales bacterium]
MPPRSPKTDDTSEYKLGRGIDYLGSIARMLRDLSGFTTLAYELLQNADDTPDATTVRFDVTPDALVVWNDGHFSDCGQQRLHPDECPWIAERGERCDFHRFRSVSAGDKGRRADLTGAFGIGFTAVYQITDQPEIISSGQHWIIDETQAEGERIRVHRRCAVCEGETGTRFILPWARNPASEFRRRTNAPPVGELGPDELAAVLERVVPTAMLFLRRIRHVDLRRNSRPLRDVVREDDADDILISDGPDVRVWRLISGDFTSDAKELRTRYPSKLEKSSEVALAVPHGGEVDGLLCAYLPTEERTGLPFHVNADFFVASDRKRLVVEGYQGEWNRAAIREAAHLLSSELIELRDVCGARHLWSLLVNAHQATGSIPRARDLGLEQFWNALEPGLRIAPILLTTKGEWTAPQAAWVVRDKEEEGAAQVLASLGAEFAAPELREFCFQLPYERSLGLTQFRVDNMVDLLVRKGLDRRLDVGALPLEMRSRSGRDLLIGEFETLLGRAPEESRRRRDTIRRVALAPGSDGAVWPWTGTFKADQRTRGLFEPFAHDGVFLDEEQLPKDALNVTNLADQFDAPVAIAWLGANDDAALSDMLKKSDTTIARVLEWFEAHSSEFVDDPDLVEELAELPLFPTQTGFRALSDLALPGDFADELGLADIVDVEQVGDALPLLRRLGARPLTFASYVRDFVPKAVDLSTNDPGRWWKLILLMAAKLNQIEDDQDALRVLADVPCVRTRTGGFERPARVYFASDAVTTILGEYPIASLPSAHPRSVEAFYDWVGVAREPRTHDVLKRVQLLTAFPPTSSTVAAISNIIGFLATQFGSNQRYGLNELAQLSTIRWLPARGDSRRWFAAQELYTTFQDYLFQSQARFLDVPISVQRSAVSLLEALGVRSTPSTGQIVSHLLHCSESGVMVNQEIYAVLNQRVDDPEVDRLKGRASVLLPSGRWVLPSHVFWDAHPFGRYRWALGTDFRRFGSLLSRIGVRERPTYDDAGAVLQEMEMKFAPTTSPVEDNDEVRVYISCWRILDEALAAEDVAAPWFERFVARKVVRDHRGVLNVPDRVFFADVPGLAERFPKELASHLIRRPEGAWRAMRAAGVRDLSRAVTTRILELGERKHDTRLRSMLSERLTQIGRVLDPFEPNWPSYVPASIASLKTFSTTRLTVEYSLDYFGMTATAAELEALFVPDDHALYVREGAEGKWLSIARELARAIAADTQPGTLAANLSLVLSAANREAADELLDQAWVPRLEHAPEGRAETELVEGFGGELGPTVTTDWAQPQHDNELPESRQTEVRAPGEAAPAAATPVAAQAKTNPETPLAAGPRSRLRSYVVSTSGLAATDDGGLKREADSAVDRSGIARVLSFERNSGRTPEEKPHENPGYDIESMGPSGSIERFIEVKSLSGPWDSYGVSVSPRQMSEARQLGEQFWLYVVARAEQDDFAIYCIQDPASKVDQFMFDDAWAAVGETSIAGRPIAPLGLIDSGARLSDRTYLPFYGILSPDLGEAGAEAGWIEWNGDALAGSYLVEVLGDALDPWAGQGSLVIVEPFTTDAPVPGDPVLVALTGESDPATGRDLAFRVWPAEEPTEDGAVQLESINLGIPPVSAQKRSMRLIGRLKVVPTISGFLG